MTPDQFKKAEDLQKQMNNHKGIFNMLKEGSEKNVGNVKIQLSQNWYVVPERLIHEFMHATQHSLNKLETEFNEL